MKQDAGKTSSFKLTNLINPIYLSQRLRSIGSFIELSKRSADLLALLFKVVTFNYGEKYWDRKRSVYMDNINNITDPYMHLEMGEYYLGKNDHEKALKSFKRALDINPDEKSAHFRMGEINYRTGEYDEAVIELRKALELDNNNKTIHKLLGLSYAKKGCYEEALAELGKALGLSRQDNRFESEVCLESASVYSELKKYELAMAELKKAIALNSQNKYAYKLSGEIHNQHGRFEEASVELKKAFDLSKEDKEFGSNVSYDLAAANLGLKQFDLAMEEAKKAAELNAGNKYAYKLSGEIYNQSGKYKEALDELKKAFDLSKGDKEFESNVSCDSAVAYVGLKKYDLAMKEAKKATELNADNKYAYKLSARICIVSAKIYSEQGKHELVIEELKKAVALDCGDMESHSLLCESYMAKGIHKEALGELSRMFELSNGDKDILERIYEKRVQIYGKQEDYSNLISGLNDLIRLDPSNVSTYISLATANKIEGRYEEAQKLFDKAMEMIKNNKKPELTTSKIEPKDSKKEENRALNESEMAGRKTKLLSRVRMLSVDLTNRCNLRCKMCFVRDVVKQEMTQKVKEEIMRALPYLEEIIWLGGEVFLAQGFNEMMDEAIRYGIKQQITTNSLLLAEELARKIVRENISLIISIDGTTPEVYEDIRKGARFKDMVGKLDMINRIKKQVNPAYELTLNVVVMRSNYRQIESFAEFAKGHGFNNINFVMVSENHNDQNIFEFNPDAEILSYVDKALENAKKSCHKYGINFNTNITKNMLNSSSSDQNAGFEKPISGEKTLCFSPWKNLHVDVGGDVHSFINCFCKNIAGNLNTQSLDEIWNGELMVNYREQIVQGNIEKVCCLKQVYNRVPAELLQTGKQNL